MSAAHSSFRQIHVKAQIVFRTLAKKVAVFQQLTPLFDSSSQPLHHMKCPYILSLQCVSIRKSVTAIYK